MWRCYQIYGNKHTDFITITVKLDYGVGNDSFNATIGSHPIS